LGAVPSSQGSSAAAERDVSAETGPVHAAIGSIGFRQQIGAGSPARTISSFPQTEHLYVSSFMIGSFLERVSPDIK
jgi:hypothetical protein